jgi:D-3-phosphoglycerate dehydrogenase / 2-oxoglutarate reductase
LYNNLKKSVILLETIDDDADRLLRNSVSVIESFISSDAVTEAHSADIRAIITRGKGIVNKKLMDTCPQLEVIARCGVGLDNIDVAEATARRIQVVNAPGSNSDTIAEHTLTLMLMAIRNAWNSVERVKAGDWAWRSNYQGDELRGKILGILGMGNIGKRVAGLASAFGMHVIYWDKFTVRSEYGAFDFDDVLKRSDIVTIHVPLLNDTHNLIGARELSLMQPHAVLINAARGAIVDEKALIKALNEEKITGYAADVLAVEPPSRNHPLINHPKTLITPHSGSLTKTTYREMCISTVENVIAILNGGKADPRSVFNRASLPDYH